MGNAPHAEGNTHSAFKRVFPASQLSLLLKIFGCGKKKLLQFSGIQHTSDCLEKEVAGGQLRVLRTLFCNSCEPVIAFKSGAACCSDTSLTTAPGLYNIF